MTLEILELLVELEIIEMSDFENRRNQIIELQTYETLTESVNFIDNTFEEILTHFE